MNIFHFSTRILLFVFGVLTALIFLQIGAGNAAVYFSFLLAICYGWPLYWVTVRGMPIQMGAPVFFNYNRETNLQTWRRTMALIIMIIGMSQFGEGKTGTGVVAIFLTIIMLTPFNRVFLAPSATFLYVLPLWINKWIIVLRNIGIGFCFFALLLTTVSIPMIAWIGLALVALHPLLLISTGKTKELATLLTIPPGAPLPARNHAPNTPRYPHPEYYGAKAYNWYWPLPPSAPRYPLDEISFSQLINGFQDSWLEAKDYHRRLIKHRNPMEFKKQVVQELKDYLLEIETRSEMHTYKRPSSKEHPPVTSVPEAIARVWHSDRRMQSLYLTTQEVCGRTDKMVILPFKIVAPHVAEYRAMANLIKRIGHLPKHVEPDISSQFNDDRYFEIIDYIIRLGRDFENYPELNANFNEERYRDYFLPFLNSVSAGYSAKGEVFHSKGKTDILVWDKDGINLFIAECKIWRGEAYLLEGVTQLFTRYVNWRDEKAALIIFNQEVHNFSGVIDVATKALSAHAWCRKPGQSRTDCSWSYLFHHPADKERTIRLELILLNFM
jgi:hypothetical protein